MLHQRNFFHEKDSLKLDADLVYFDLTLDPRYPFSICIDLVCGENISPRKALVQFLVDGDLVEPALLGAIRSENADVGFYRYLKTAPGVTTSHFTITPWPGFDGKLRIAIRTWWEDDSVALQSLVAMSNVPVALLAENFAAVRNVGRYDLHCWDGLDSFLAAPELTSGLHTISLNNLLLDFFLVIRLGVPLLVHLHGNAPRSESLQLPVLAGWRVTEDINASLLMLSDPSLLLDPQFELAWHAGSESVPLQYIYELVLRKIESACQPTKMIFWGGSGGGFASLYLSSLFERSLALVWNPQTAIKNYETEAVAKFKQIALGIESEAESDGNFFCGLLVDDVADLYLTKKNNTVIYLQNASDWHAAAHLEPFLRKIGAPETAAGHVGWIDDWLYLYFQDLSEGHNPPPPELIRALLLHCVNTEVKDFDIQSVIVAAQADMQIAQT